MATTASGVTIPGSSPTTTAATPIQDHWNNLGKSLNGRVVVPVASVTARAALVAALTAEGYTISAANPLYVHRADATPGSELEVTINGTTFTTIFSAKATVKAELAPSGNIGAGLANVIVASAVTGDGVRMFKVTFTFYQAVGTVSGDTFEALITRNGGIVGGLLFPVPADGANGRTVVIFDTPPSGTATYTGAIQRATGTGTVSVFASPSRPAHLIVEQIS